MNQKLIFRTATIADEESISLLANQLSEFIKNPKLVIIKSIYKMRNP
jgi:hypothetical protein